MKKGRENYVVQNINIQKKSVDVHILFPVISCSYNKIT